MQKVAISLAAAAVMFAPTYQAVAQINTDCNVFMNTWSCESYDPNANAKALGTMLGNIARINRERAEREAAAEAERHRAAQQQEANRQLQEAYARQQQAQAQAQQREQDFLTIVSQAIQAGECEDAKAIALSWSRLEVADQAARLCKPKAVQKTASRSKSKARR